MTKVKSITSKTKAAAVKPAVTKPETPAKPDDVKPPVETLPAPATPPVETPPVETPGEETNTDAVKDADNTQAETSTENIIKDLPAENVTDHHTEGDHTFEIPDAKELSKKEKAFYKGKVKLSDAGFDVMDQKEAKNLVESSEINQHYKEIMLKQIADGALTQQYAASLKRIKSASDGGSIYRPGIDGL